MSTANVNEDRPDMCVMNLRLQVSSCHSKLFRYPLFSLAVTLAMKGNAEKNEERSDRSNTDHHHDAFTVLVLVGTIAMMQNANLRHRRAKGPSQVRQSRKGVYNS